MSILLVKFYVSSKESVNCTLLMLKFDYVNEYPSIPFSVKQPTFEHCFGLVNSPHC